MRRLNSKGRTLLKLSLLIHDSFLRFLKKVPGPTTRLSRTCGGGLLSSSCTESGDDDSNLLFVNLLSELTKLQARLLNYICENAPKSALPNGLIDSEDMTIAFKTLQDITGETNIHRLDLEIDHLREVGLIYGGFDPYGTADPVAQPSAIALNMYVRCHGSRESPIDFFCIEIQDPEPAAQESNDESSTDG